MNKIIVANWKMNPQSQKEAEILFKKILTISKNEKNSRIIVCPPFPYLYIFKKYNNKKVFLGTQNISRKSEGSHTGEVSPQMIIDMGAKYSIVGHGEERALGETDEVIKEKILNLFKFKISPVLCVGEKERDKEGLFLSFVENELKGCLSGIPKNKLKNIIIAYEPIWAIGKNSIREATKEEFIEMKIFIRKVISDMYGSQIARNVPILYGGSVNSENTKLFVKDGGADGLLIGRDSLNPEKFFEIIKKLK